MYIAIYCSVIALVVLGIVLFFVIRNKRSKQRLMILKREVRLENTQILNTTSLGEFETVEPKIKEEILEKPILEKFSLDEKTESKIKPDLRKIPFNLLDEDDEFDDDEFIDEKFAEYENFLKNNTNFENNKTDEVDEMKSLANFDINSLKGKSTEEIGQIIKNLPPKIQELLLSNVLAKKNYDDKD